MKRALLWGLVCIIIALGLSEYLLRVLDPTGAYIANMNQAAMWRVAYVPPDDRPYLFSAGVHDMQTWTMRINQDGTRYTPASNTASPCQIVVLGDSITFGMGVNDDQTFVNLLAKELPIQWVNAAMPGYNIWDTLTMRTAHPGADGYLYYVVPNDAEKTITIPQIPVQSYALRVYSNTQGTLPPEDIAGFRAALQRFIDPPKTQVISGSRWAALNGLSVAHIPGYSSRISRADGHPDATGHQQIADQLLPIVRPWIEDRCR